MLSGVCYIIVDVESVQCCFKKSVCICTLFACMYIQSSSNGVYMVALLGRC